MKKLIGLLAATFAMGIALPVLAADSQPELNMNVRFMQTDMGSQAENRMQLHVVELSASQQIDNIGGSVLYRIGDTTNAGVVGGTKESYPVEAKAFYTAGDLKITGGLQFVPFGIYKWNNLYNPFLDIPGQMGAIWDSDWGYLVNYSPKPVSIDLGYWVGAGELTTIPGLNTNGTSMVRESAEKDTITARVGWDILSNLNVGASYLNGKIDMNADTFARVKKTVWALDTTWGIIPNLQLEAEYADAKMKSGAGVEQAAAIDGKGNFGLIQLKYDITKVPAPFNKITPVIEYSWMDPKGGTKIKNYQEELWVKAGKNLDVFFQNVQQKESGVDTAKSYVLAVKYSFK